SMLQAYGMSMDDVRAEMKTMVQLRKLLGPQVEVTDEMVEKYFEENENLYVKEPEQVRASHILVETQEEAEGLLVELNGGADFAALAEEHSLDEASKVNGGDLDFFAQAEMDPAFGEAAFALEIGELSDIVQSSHGYHIIKATDYKAVVPGELEHHKEELRQQYIDQDIYKQEPPRMEELKAGVD